MALVDLSVAKQHLRIDHDEEDVLLGLYLQAAEQHVLTHCSLAEAPAGRTATFAAATLLHLGDLYANRESQVIGAIIAVSDTVAALLRPYLPVRY